MKKKLNNFPCSTLSCEGYHCVTKMQIDVGKKCLNFVYQFKRNRGDIIQEHKTRCIILYILLTIHSSGTSKYEIQSNLQRLLGMPLTSQE